MLTCTENFLRDDFIKNFDYEYNHFNPFDSTVPTVNFPFFDSREVRVFLDWAKSHIDQAVDESAKPKYKPRWYSLPQYNNWYSLYVYGSFTTYDHQNTPSSHTITPPDDYRVVLDIFEQKGLYLKECDYMILKSKGWVGMHTDTFENNPLAHFWIPLNMDTPSLKIYPHGWVQSNIGDINFINQRFVHAAVNNSDTDRYVLTGEIDTEKSQPDVIKKITNTIKNQLTIDK